MLAAGSAANATTFLDFSSGLSGWTTGGNVTLSSTTVTVPTGGPTFTLTPAAGYQMARINAPDNGNLLAPNTQLGLSANSLQNFLNNGGSITNFGLLTQSFSFNPGTYTFAWAYGAEDYQPYNDGAVFSLSGGGTQSLVSLARNGRSPSDTSGPSPGTLILGSYGATPWLTMSFNITTAGTYQVGFAVYNWSDRYLAPNLYVSGIEGTYSGTPAQLSGGTLPPPPPPIIGTSGGNVSSSVFNTSSAAYGATTLTFDGGTLQYTSSTVTSKDAVLTGAGAIDTNGQTVQFTGAISGSSDFFKKGAGTLVLTNTNSYTGQTSIDAGTVQLTGTGNIASSSAVINNGTLDISGTTAGAAVKTMSGTGTVELGAQALTVSDASSTFAGSINGSGAFELAGGSFALGGTNTYTGNTLIDGGTLKLTGNGSVAASNAIINNGVFDISGTAAGASIKTLAGSGSVELGSQPLTLTNASGSYGGTINGGGAVQLVGGEITLTGANTYVGGTYVSNGAKLIVADDSALGDLAGALTLDNGVVANTGNLSLAHDVVVAGTSAFDAAADSSITAAGKLSGTGYMVKIGAGSLVLAADNSAFGQNDPTASIVINDGNVVVTNEKGLGNASVMLNSGSLSTETGVTLQNALAVAPNTSISTAPDTTFVINAPVTSVGAGNGCFTKSGAGTLVLTGRADIDAGTCVQNGRLYANGLLNSTVTVESNGFLRGTGTITGPIVVQGRLAAGNSPGTLQTTASVTMTAGSTYQEDINGVGLGQGPGNYSRLLITGAGSEFVATGATLESNLLHITGSDTYIPYVPKVGDAFRIITAEGGIVGEFANVTQPDGLAPNTRIEVYYNVANSHSIDLFIVPTSYGAYVEGSSGNQNALSSAAVLDTLVVAKAAGSATDSQNALLYAASTEPETAIEATATALAGELHGALVAVAPLANRWLVDSVQRQLTNGLITQGSHDLWLDMGANRSDWKSDSIASGFDSDRSQIAIGWDLIARDSGRLGVGFTHGKVDVRDAEGSGSVTHDIGFVYGQLDVQRVILDGIGAFGSSDWETDRFDPIAPLTSLSAKLGGHDALVSLGMRLPIVARGFSLSPYARATWEQVSRDSFDEGATSAAALTSSGISNSGTRVTAGLVGGSLEQRPLATRFAYQFNVGIGREARSMTRAAFGATLAGLDTTISSPNVGRTFGFGQLNTTARLNGRTYSYFGVSAETRSGKSSDLGVNLGVRMTF